MQPGEGCFRAMLSAPAGVPAPRTQMNVLFDIPMKFPLPVPLSFLRFGKECRAFRTPSDMLAHLDHICAQHPWSNRPQKILAAVDTLKT